MLQVDHTMFLDMRSWAIRNVRAIWTVCEWGSHKKERWGRNRLWESLVRALFDLLPSTKVYCYVIFIHFGLWVVSIWNLSIYYILYCRCGVALDVWMMPLGSDIHDQEINQPLFFINTYQFHKWKENVNELKKLVQGKPGENHWFFWERLLRTSLYVLT